MTYQEFLKCFESLTDYFGESAYSPKASSVIWKIIEPLTPGEWEQVVCQLAEEFTRAPTPGQIRKQAYPILLRAREREFKGKLDALLESGQICQKCGYTGFVTAVLRTNHMAEFSFRCPFCPASGVRKHGQSIPLWNDDFKKDYMPISLAAYSFTAFLDLQRKSWGKLPDDRKRKSMFVDLAEKILDGGVE